MMGAQIEKEIAHLDWAFTPTCAALKCNKPAMFHGKFTCCAEDYMLCEYHKQIASNTLAWARANSQRHGKCSTRIDLTVRIEWSQVTP